MNEKKVIKSSKDSDVLPHSLQEILYWLKLVPTTKAVMKHIKKDKRIVSRDIKRLIDKGYIKRIDRGVYKVIKRDKVEVIKHQKYYRLHNLEVELLVNSDKHKHIKATVFKNKQFFNARKFGRVGEYIDFEITGLITRENIFFMFPEGFELVAEQPKELGSIIYDTIEEVAKKWEQRFKLNLFSDGKINFNIRNIHIAYVEGEFSKELHGKDITSARITDNKDGKTRFLIDWSKGFPEFEAVHPEKAIYDAHDIEQWGETLADGSYKKLIEDVKEIMPSDIKKYVDATQEQLKELTQGQINTNKQLQSVIEILKPKNIQSIEETSTKDQKRIPDYVG